MILIKTIDQIEDLLLIIKQQMANNPFYLDINPNIKTDFQNSRGPLRGILFDIKLNYLTKNFKSDAASLVLQKFKPSYDAEIYKALINYGAVMVGKTNCDEFAAGSLGVNSAYGPVYYQNCYTGGSSSGAGYTGKKIVHLAIGSETGGSCRLPALFTRSFGYKPSFGATSRYGMIEYSKSLDTVGFIFQDPSIMIKVFNYAMQYDPKDSMSNAVRKTNEIPNLCILYSQLFNEYELPILQFLKSTFKYEESNITFNHNAINALYTNKSCMDIFSECFKFDKLRYQNTGQHKLEELKNYTSERYKDFGKFILNKFAYGSLLLSNAELRNKYYLASMKKISQIILTLNALTKDKILVMPSMFPDIDHTESLLKLANFAGLPSIVLPIKDSVQYPSTVPLKYSGVILIGGYHRDLSLLSIANQYYKNL